LAARASRRFCSIVAVGGPQASIEPFRCSPMFGGGTRRRNRHRLSVRASREADAENAPRTTARGSGCQELQQLRRRLQLIVRGPTDRPVSMRRLRQRTPEHLDGEPIVIDLLLRAEPKLTKLLPQISVLLLQLAAAQRCRSSVNSEGRFITTYPF
jgi:hypothetical protein